MNLTIVAGSSVSHQARHAAALQRGLQAHGIQAPIVTRDESVQTAHVACWGWRRGQVHKAAGRQVLVMERGYLGDRFAWTSLGWNGLNGLATFARVEDGGDRFRAHFGALAKRWRTGGDYVLIVGQVPGDMALGGRDLRPWYDSMAARCAKLYGLPVRFRPHPLAAKRGRAITVRGAPDLCGTLDEALAGAALVVTYNSNVGVDALLAGRPTVAVHRGSMAFGVAHDTLPPSLDLPEPARMPWLHALAWKQFTMAEIESGYPWKFIAPA